VLVVDVLVFVSAERAVTLEAPVVELNVALLILVVVIMGLPPPLLLPPPHAVSAISAINTGIFLYISNAP
jgi:hypothetical protein